MTGIVRIGIYSEFKKYFSNYTTVVYKSKKERDAFIDMRKVFADGQTIEITIQPWSENTIRELIENRNISGIDIEKVMELFYSPRTEYRNHLISHKEYIDKKNNIENGRKQD